jgi:phenylacetic acid degradation operon negative regulatory protein
MLSREVGDWRQRESLTRQWRGAWIGIHLDRLGSGERVRRRRRDRALSLLGFREWRKGLALRPDNLHRGAKGIRKRLEALGVDPGQPVFRMGGLDRSLDGQAQLLWNTKSLNQAYRNGLGELAQSRERVSSLDLDAAAAETFVVGGRALRSLAFDPLLPPPLADVDARRSFADAVRRYDDLGRGYWTQLLGAPMELPRTVASGTSAAANPPGLRHFSSQLDA